MAGEAVLKLRIGDPVDFIVSNTTGIEKGTILKMTDNMTAIINSGIDDLPAGIAHREKITTDGRTRLAVWRSSIFEVLCSGTCTVGDAVAISATVNAVYSPPLATASSLNIGIMLETVTDGNRGLMELRPGTSGKQVS